MQTQLIGSSGAPLFDIFGPLLQFLVTPAQTSGSFALMRGVVAPGIAIPLHSHADPEVLFVLHGGPKSKMTWHFAKMVANTIQRAPIFCHLA
jgi:quercetin dioxygenase-like cupin family protein